MERRSRTQPCQRNRDPGSVCWNPQWHKREREAFAQQPAEWAESRATPRSTLFQNITELFTKNAKGICLKGVLGYTQKQGLPGHVGLGLSLDGSRPQAELSGLAFSSKVSTSPSDE